MKTAKLFIFIGAVIAGLLCKHPPARAQPAGGSGSDKGNPASPSGDPTSTDDDSSAEDDSILVDDPTSPWSQGVSVEDRRAARALLREGTRLYLIPLYARAAEQYSVALRKWKHPGLYYNLALTQLNLGKESDALENFERALKYGEKPLGPKRFVEAQKQLAELKRLLGRLRVTCRVPGAEVTLDGVMIFTGPGKYEGWVKAKSHELTAKKAGYLSEARRVTVASDQLQDVDLKLVTLSQATDAGRRWAAWKPWAVVGTGAALVAAGGTLHALAFRNVNSYDDQFRTLPCATEPPEAPPGCTEDDIGANRNTLLRHARQEQVIAVGAYIAGGSLIATGIVLLYVNRPRLTEPRSAIAATRGMELVPVVSGDTLGILVRLDY